MDDSGNAPERVGEIALGKVFDDGNVDLVAALGVNLFQRVSLWRPRDCNEALSTAANRNVANSSPSNAVALFQEAYHNVCTGIARHTSKLCIEDEHSNGATWNSIVRTKTSSEDIGSKSGVWDWDLRMRFGMRLVAAEVASYILIPAPAPTSRSLSNVPRSWTFHSEDELPQPQSHAAFVRHTDDLG